MQQYSLPILKKPFKPSREIIKHSLDTSSYFKILKQTSKEINFAEYVLKKQHELELAMKQALQKQKKQNQITRNLPKLLEQQKTSPYLIKALKKNRMQQNQQKRRQELNN